MCEVVYFILIFLFSKISTSNTCYFCHQRKNVDISTNKPINNDKDQHPYEKRKKSKWYVFMDALYLNQQAVTDSLPYARHNLARSWGHSNRRICPQGAYFY